MDLVTLALAKKLAGSGGGSGTPGKGIQKIEKTNTEGLVDTYTITYTDSTTSTFTVTNGKDGEDADGNFLPLSGGTMAGSINMGGNEIWNAIDIEANNTVTGKTLKAVKRTETGLVTDIVMFDVPESGILSISKNVTGDGVTGVVLRGLEDPIENTDAATKAYVDANAVSIASLSAHQFSDLNTTSKTIVGAINEILEKINAVTPAEGESILTVTTGDTE